MTTRFNIRLPRGKRRSFSIIKQTRLYSGKTQNETIQNSDLEYINQLYQNGSFDFETAERNARAILDRLNKVKEVIYNQDNYKILDEYWNKIYKRRNLIDKRGAYHPLRRAIEAVENLPLTSATEDEMQSLINRKFKGNKQRRIVSSLNSILKWMNRDIILVKQRPVRYKVKYLVEPELKEILKYVDHEPYKILIQVAFYTGGRIGEIGAFEIQNLNEVKRTVRISEQLDKNDSLRDTKNRKVRTAFIFPNGIEAFKQWVNIKSEVSAKERQRMARVTRRASQLAFPKDPSKHIKFHDLRHSYAIALISSGVSLTLVSQCIGDSIKVTEDYYTGFEISSESIEIIRNLVDKKIG